MFGLLSGGSGGLSASSGARGGPQDARQTTTNSLGNITFGAKNPNEKWLWGALAFAAGVLVVSARRKGR